MLSCAVLALLLSLPVAMWLGVHIDVVALAEALPFLVCTIGFDKPMRLARAVFEHPGVLGVRTIWWDLLPKGMLIFLFPG